MLWKKRIVWNILFWLVLVVSSSLVFAQDETVAAHKAAIEQVYAETFNAGDMTVMESLYAPDYVLHGYGDDLDLAGYQAVIEAMRAAMPDFETTIEVLIAEDDWAATRVLHTGTFENAWVMDGEAIPANDEVISWSAITLHRFDENGLIVEDFTAFDMLNLLIQMDAAPIPNALALLIGTREHYPAVMGETVATDMLEANETAFTEIIERGINNGDFSAMETYMDEDYGLHEPFGDFNREQFIAVIAGFRAAVPDLHVTIDAVLREGDWIGTRLIYEGTFSNSIDLGAIYVEATNEPIRFIINVLIHFDGTGIGLEDFKEYNRLAWLNQLQVLPME
ncbi:MAG: ester cyclase [Anaerolineae bacterium]